MCFSLNKFIIIITYTSLQLELEQYLKKTYSHFQAWILLLSKRDFVPQKKREASSGQEVCQYEREKKIFVQNKIEL